MKKCDSDTKLNEFAAAFFCSVFWQYTVFLQSIQEVLVLSPLYLVQMGSNKIETKEEKIYCPPFSGEVDSISRVSGVLFFAQKAC